jgi:predicted nucleotidyltransferase
MTNNKKFPGRVILEAVVGSTVHGTSVNDGLEDLDLMAIVIEESSAVLGFNQTDTWTMRTKPEGVRSEAGDVDWVGYGLRKYLKLALKGNPSVLIPLFAPYEHVKIRTHEGYELQQLVPDIISQTCIAPFRGYMHQQMERLFGLRGQKNVTRPELVEKFGYDTKYAAHIVRLGLQGAELLQTGRLTLPMRDAERELCFGIRAGKFTLTAIKGIINETQEKLQQAIAETKLPKEPNTKKVEDWMITAYLRAWE